LDLKHARAMQSLPHGIESPPEPAPSRQGHAHVLSRPRILLADDNADMSNYLARLLATHYEVTTVSDGAQALAAARAAPPELILTDVMMPVLDGFGLLRELRADERTRTIPVILLSARSGEESAVEGLQAAQTITSLSLSPLANSLHASEPIWSWRNCAASDSGLERQVQERTAELFQTCQDLEVEVTERKQAERKLLEAQQVVMQQERLRALGEMASGIAHDINNAISPAALYTESLLEREPGLSERARSCLTTIQIAIEDVAETVSRMREFYRPRETEMVLSRVACNRVLEQVINLTRARWSDLPQQRGVVGMRSPEALRK